MRVPSGDWPDRSLQQQAGRIGSALLELIDAETRWVHRRVERLELSDTAQVTRSVAADITVPVALASRLRLYASPLPTDPYGPPADTDDATPSRIVVPLGTLRKAPLEDFSLTPDDCQRVSADQTRALLVPALAPYANACGANAKAVLGSLATIIRSEETSDDELAELTRLLAAAGERGAGDPNARDRLLRIAKALSDHYILLVAITAAPGLPTRVVYTHRQTIDAVSADVGDAPLTFTHELPYVAGNGPSFRIEILAPDGLEIEAATMFDPGPPRTAIKSEIRAPGKGAYVHVKAPDGPSRPDRTELKVVFGFPAGGIHHLAFAAGLASTSALAVAVGLSFWLDERFKGSSASALIAAPALVTGLALGFATTRVTSMAVNRLRLAALAIALFGVLGGLTVALFGESEAHLNARHGILVALLVASLLTLGSWQVPAFMRSRPKPPDHASS